jgi:hypothetical protein
VPVNHEASVSQAAYESGNEKGWDGRRILDKKPLRWLKAVAENAGEMIKLNQHFPRPEDQEGNGTGPPRGWREFMYPDLGIVE